MLRCALFLLVALTTGALGCSFIYDPDKLSATGDDAGSADARTDGAIPPDAQVVDAIPLPDVEPDVLAVFRASPETVHEGAGFARAVPVVLFGQNFSPDAEVAISGVEGIEIVDPWTVSGDGRYAALTLRLPVIEPCAGESLPLTVTVTQGDETVDANLTFVCLAELVLDGSFSTDSLPAEPSLFSRIEVAAGGVRVTGENPLRLVSMGDITLHGPINANGEGRSGGPGGCDGGAANEDGGCGDGGGQSGGTKAGGGGGGFGTPGVAGISGGGSGGAPGGTTGDEMLAPFVLGDAEGARGNGGGGGDGNGAGAGGGGGGVVALTAKGAITLEAGAGISVDGGKGGDGGGLIGLCTGGGGGGGGSGGAILLRGYAGIAIDPMAETITATGGGGGAASNGCGAGGGGGYGRARIDSPAPVADGAISEFVPTAQGPMWVDLPTITASESITIDFAGESGRAYGLAVNGGAAQTVSAGAPVEVTLRPGHNTLCLLVKQGASLEQSEAKNCLTIAYISP